MLDIHPSAIENINSKSLPLLQLIQEIPHENKKSSKIPSDIVTISVDAKDIIGEIIESLTDYKGNIVGRFFSVDNIRFGLIDSSYQNLKILAQSIHRLPLVKERLSLEFIEREIFNWLKIRHTDTSSNLLLVDFLNDVAKQSVKKITAIIPIANMRTEVPFEFCGCLIDNIPKSMFDEMEELIDLDIDDSQKVNAFDFISKIRKDFQGYAAVRVEMECEPTYAEILSISQAQKITDLLGIYSGATIIHDMKSTSKIKGTENLEIYNIFFLEDRGFNFRSKISDMGSGGHWLISKKDLIHHKKCGLDILSSLVTSKSLSEFQSVVLNMAYLYAKSAFTSDPMAKLVYMLSALESTLLRNENEPIQQNLAERIAFSISSELKERKSIIKNVKSIYGLRSRYLHHGHSPEELNELRDFFIHVWCFYIHLIGNSHTFKTKNEFLDVIDDRKLS